MCGIAGFLSTKFPSGSDMEQVVRSMAGQLKHRGPDDGGAWLDSSAGLALAHRRLSILDISNAGHQPMESPCGRYVLIFNGEIYNHIDLRLELAKAGINSNWRGHSDTETLLLAISNWGLEQTLQKSIGMFAIALWDRAEKSLCLARDRMGEKPLYYGLDGSTLLFASELKGVRVFPGFKNEINRQAIALQLRYSSIPAPFSIYQEIFKLLPGTILKVTQFDIVKGNLPLPQPYWSLREIADKGQQNLFTGSDKEAIDQLEHLLLQSVNSQMISDVPLGAFLSGGIDSSTIVALMQAQSERPVKTFTIGFNEKGYNEAEHAKLVAKHLGTDHTELYVSSSEAMNVIPQLPTLYDEPFSDSSQIPTFLISHMTRQHVTVSLSGDGGDELFGGYNRYLWVNKIWNKVGWIPKPIRKLLASGISSVTPESWEMMLRHLPRSLRVSQPGDKAHKLASILSASNRDILYQRLISHWDSTSNVVIGADERTTTLADQSLYPEFEDFEHLMMYLDSMNYLPDDILAKVDRAAMGVSLETRVPFLDHRLVEFAWSLPLSMKIRENQGKWLLRQVLYKYVPKELIERPKMGFSVPIDQWLRGPLREWAEELLEPSRIRQEGYFNYEPIRKKWLEHLSGKQNWQYYLWDVLMFQAWLSAN